MKKIENKKTQIALEIKDGPKSNYSDLIGLSLNNTVEGGYTVDEMESRLRIKAATTPSTKAKFEIEDADFVKLQEIVKVSRWSLIHQDIVDFKNYIAGIK